MTNHHRTQASTAKNGLPSGRCVGTPRTAAWIPGHWGEDCFPCPYPLRRWKGTPPGISWGGPKAVKLLPRRTEGHHTDQKEGGWVEPSGSLEGRAEARVPSLQQTRQQDWRGLPKVPEASRFWDAPRAAGERSTAGDGGTSGTGADMPPRVSVEATDTSRHLRGQRNVVGSVLDWPERGREAAFLPLAARSPLLAAPGPPEAANVNQHILLEEYAESVMGFISKCVEDVTIIKNITTRANQKPWLTREGLPLEDFGGGPDCSPGTDSEESYGPTLDVRDWYNDVQYLESDSTGSYYPERPSVILASLHTRTTGEGHWTIWGGPEYGPGMDSAESHRPQPDYEDRHSAGSYDLDMDCYEGYVDYGDRGECGDISLWSDLESDYMEDLPMEVEEVLYGNPPTDSDAQSAVSKNDEPPAPKILPKAPSRRYRLGTEKPSHVKYLEAETPFARAHSHGIRAPIPKPHRGRKEAAPVPTPEMGKVAGAPPEDASLGRIKKLTQAILQISHPRVEADTCSMPNNTSQCILHNLGQWDDIALAWDGIHAVRMKKDGIAVLITTDTFKAQIMQDWSITDEFFGTHSKNGKEAIITIEIFLRNEYE
ncbi:hypothetical protein P4O66_002753 [Electrophorus voltai]|uniref:Uncharacterized protein n=1 Tax=Electrophorus voltai TaxID=2609070 RepID=A0AAD8YUM5_9TELE|nr:hypothetical protein P4O66_002753 [Electrophorus voltai]